MSYPLLVESLDAPPYVLGGMSNVWPFSYWGSPSESRLIPSVMFHLWWAGLTIVAFSRVKSRHRRRVLLLLVGVPLITFVSSYLGCYLGDAVCDAF